MNLCEKTGASPRYVACQYRRDSTAQLLLNNDADVNLCEKTWISPLYIACQNGHDSTAQLLLKVGLIKTCAELGSEISRYIVCMLCYMK